MTMPSFDCPVCRNPLTWDVVFAHQGVRDAMIALVNAHPDGKKLLRPLLSYIGLFSPKKSAMRYERIASLANELVGMIGKAQIERNDRIYSAPADYWQEAMNEIVMRHHSGSLRVPLTSHGYLLEIIAGYSNKAEAAAEKKLEQQRSGYAGAGRNPARQMTPVSQNGPVPANATLSKSEMPQYVRDELNLLKDKRRQHGN